MKGIQVIGLKELQRDIKRQQGKLPASIGVAHKEIGRFIIGKLPAGDPHAVGAGSGAKVRPSATKREVILRVGTSTRATRAQQRHVPTKHIQWGKTDVWPPLKDARPHIIGTALEHQDKIEEMFKDSIVKALKPAFHSAE